MAAHSLLFVVIARSPHDLSGSGLPRRQFEMRIKTFHMPAVMAGKGSPCEISRPFPATVHCPSQLSLS